jgi:uncharacterized repeat protein (TIGR02543 family)
MKLTRTIRCLLLTALSGASLGELSLRGEVVSPEIAPFSPPSAAASAALNLSAEARFQTTGDIPPSARIQPLDSHDNDGFGETSAISGDTIAITALGAAPYSSRIGCVYVFIRNGDTWIQQARLTASYGEDLDNFGEAIALSGDTLVVGASGEDSNASGVNGNENNNGARDAGAAYVFVRQGGQWTQQAYLKASNPDARDWFGRSVAISGDTIVVGAHGEDSNARGINGNQSNNSAEAAGAAYVFVRHGATWTQQAYLKAFNTDADDQFGYEVDISGDTIVVGAGQEDSSNGNPWNNDAENSGAAYVFVRSDGMWRQQAYLKAANADPGDAFGRTVTLSEDTIAVGAHLEDSSATGVNGDPWNNDAENSGAVYVLVRTGATWSQEAYLKPSLPGTYLRGPMVLSGDTLLVNNTVFVREDSTWRAQGSLEVPSNYYQWPPALSGNTAVMGVFGWEEIPNMGYPPGAAYVFTLSFGYWLQVTAPHGTVTGGGEYPPGSTAVLTATPDPGYVFTGWTGDASGTDNPLSVLMDSGKSIGATFEPDERDFDDDGLSNYQEAVIYGTDPHQPDSDDDGIPDGVEVNYDGSTYLLVEGAFTWAQAREDAQARRGRVAVFPQASDYLRFANRARARTDAALWLGLSDQAEEGVWQWDDGSPLTYQRWQPGQPDGGVAENRGGIFPYKTTWADAPADFVAGGYLFERVGLNPNDPDSDQDGLWDKEERDTVGSSPVDPDTDGDGLADGEEVHTYGSNPLNADTDGDGLSDYDEVRLHHSDPTRQDTDGDGFDDRFEVETGYDPASDSSTPEAYAEMRIAVEFRFNAAAGSTYQIETSTDLEQWDPVESGIVGEGATISRLYRIKGDKHRYFRAVRE